MKTRLVGLPRFLAALVVTSMSCVLPATFANDGVPRDLSHTVQYELGKTQFAPGDNITIQQMRGTSETIATGGTYSVEGTYTLASEDEAVLAFYTTTISINPTPIGSEQRIRIKKGSGSFRLVQNMTEDGYFHVSFYPANGGKDFGGVYFGQGNRILRIKEFNTVDQPMSSVDRSGNDGFSEKPMSLSGPNQALLEYLGDPVDPPANMDPRYTKEGLINAVQLAARNAGITLKKVVIDDSEYPFLVGLICGGDSDYSKLTDQIKKIDGYNYNGSIGSSTCHAFNILPYHAYPPETSQRINHRAWLRQQIFYDKLHAQE